MPTGVWRSHFRGLSESVDPGGYANTTTNTSFLVREDDLLLTRGGTTDSDPGSDSDLAGSFMVAVGVNDIVTVSTRMEGVPSVAPTLPQSPPPSRRQPPPALSSPPRAAVGRLSLRRTVSLSRVDRSDSNCSTNST